MPFGRWHDIVFTVGIIVDVATQATRGRRRAGGGRADDSRAGGGRAGGMGLAAWWLGSEVFMRIFK